ncbi:MAG: DUF2666 family protein [Candidatus Micrarchaeota archaeon]|nr:DUF2666 family protein [Candidatus Micrarchaeota archaeon]
MDEIAFSAKYKEWISIKKMDIDEKTTPPEVVHMLSNVRESISRKAFELSGIDKGKIDAYVLGLIKGKRKGYPTLSEIFGGMKQNEVRGVLLSASSEQLLPIAETYLMRKLLTSLGYNADISGEMMSKIYPELKLPKPKGRFGKKKE